MMATENEVMERRLLNAERERLDRIARTCTCACGGVLTRAYIEGLPSSLDFAQEITKVRFGCWTTGTGELKNEAPAQGNGAKKPHQKASPGQIDRVRQLMGELALSEERITKPGGVACGRTLG